MPHKVDLLIKSLRKILRSAIQDITQTTSTFVTLMEQRVKVSPGVKLANIPIHT